MAAINRSILFQLLNTPAPRFRVGLKIVQHERSARRMSMISRLQPVFPEKRDESLFEDWSEEYQAVDHLALQQPENFAEKSHPCDALASAAFNKNFELGTNLLQEYREAKIEVIHRPEYEIFADASLKKGDFESFLDWLSLVPAIGDVRAVKQPTNNIVVQDLTKDRMRFQELTRLLVLYSRKGWTGPVPADSISLLARYSHPKTFERLFNDVLSLSRSAHEDPDACRSMHLEWRSRAIAELSKRNCLELALGLLKDHSSEVDLSTLSSFYLSVKRNKPSIIPQIRRILPLSMLRQLDAQVTKQHHFILTNRKLARQSFKLSVHRRDTLSRTSYAAIYSDTARIVRALKQELLARPTHTRLDPRAIAFFFFNLTKYYGRQSLLDRFRRRIWRSGDVDIQSLWATVEMELLCYRGDSLSAIHYYKRAFYEPGMPLFLRGRAFGHWKKWLAQTPSQTPPLPQRKLRPSAISLMACWKAAITLSLRHPDVSSRKSSSTLIDGENERHMDISVLNDLFQDFLSIFDRGVAQGKTFYSNPYTRVRYFELFLKRYAMYAPEMCGQVMQQIQSRGILLDHRIWAVFAKSRVQHGEPAFMLRIFSLLEKDAGGPPDFSPAALTDRSNLGVKPPAEGSEGDTVVPQKVLSAYLYGLRQLISVGALAEALELHKRILEAGYKEGSSLSLDRLVHWMLDILRPMLRYERHKGGHQSSPDEVLAGENLHDIHDVVG
ncbi:hypothetical protein CPB86DRAFT_760265 [Serendipita vermifera]|nr:hypothetical protein CPB86DRAFT_760265 [Serendipita vermifera]